ncbi:hypothetical protein [Rhodoligotrophos appendicifer]|uniref:hypothetical protein n=1 Tax=Rhodoligotrophos appendicifer TaxID=987056 RepID=UPI00117F1E12|nr:hypothetical protein [Rhodoligotrophos appendicifer]
MPGRRDHPNIEMLRDRIDGGGTNDKVKGSDPAAAPLGTDEEAGGNPPSEAEFAVALRYEPPQIETDPSRTNGRINGVVGYGLLTTVIAIVLLSALAWGLSR